jgi:hypothetical protein
MINLLVNFILFVLRMFNAATFGLIDNLATVYSILVFSTFFVILKLDSAIQICDFWRKSGKFIKVLLLLGVLLNSLPQWYLWLIGMILIILAYFIKPKEGKKSSLFSKIKAVVVEEYQESDFKAKTSSTIQKTKNAAQKSSKNRTDPETAKELPPI